MKSFITSLFIPRRFQSWLNWEMKCRMQCRTIATSSSFSSRCSHKNRWLRLWFGYLRTHFKYSVIAVIKKLFSTPPPSLKNGLGGNLIFYSANLQCNIYCIIKLNRCCWPSLIWEHISKSCSLGTNKLPNIVDTIAPLLTLSLSSKTRSSKLRFIFENSAVTSSSSNWTKLMFHISS